MQWIAFNKQVLQLEFRIEIQMLARVFSLHYECVSTLVEFVETNLFGLEDQSIITESLKHQQFEHWNESQ